MSAEQRSTNSTSFPLTSQHHPATPFRINYLPSEIVGRVFEACVALPCSLNPLTLMLVSKDWYHLALGTPTLWTRISLPPYIQYLEEKVASYLARSKTLPVSVIIGRRSSIGCLRVITLFDGHLERIWSLTCVVSVGNVDILWSEINKMAVLEELVLEKSPEISATITSQRGNNLNVPSLKKLNVGNVDISWANTHLSQIEDLQLVYTQFQGVLVMDRLFDALSRFTTLKKLFIGLYSNFPLYIRFWEENGARPKGPTNLPLLKELKLKGLPDQQVEMVLREIVAPGLDTIFLLEGRNEGFITERWPALSGHFPRAIAPRLIK